MFLRIICLSRVFSFSNVTSYDGLEAHQVSTLRYRLLLQKSHERRKIVTVSLRLYFWFVSRVSFEVAILQWNIIYMNNMPLLVSFIPIINANSLR